MRVLKIVAEGLVTSFRYPHFMQQVQPTFEMPPPATIYGHICSALGDWFDPSGVEFAIHFTFEKQFEDKEHTHIVGRSTGKIKGTGWTKALEGAVNPFSRGLLFRPRLALYLNKPEWFEAFRNPYYPVVLGRSQDLFTYSSVNVVSLLTSSEAYFEHTIAQHDFVRRTARGIVVLMPKYLDYSKLRRPIFERYVMLHRRIIAPDDLLRYEGESPGEYLVDPDSVEHQGRHLGLLFHRWV